MQHHKTTTMTPHNVYNVYSVDKSLITKHNNCHHHYQLQWWRLLDLYRLAIDHWRSSIFPLSYCLQHAIHRLSIQLCILMDMYSAGICAVLLLLLHSIMRNVSVRRTRLHCSLKHVYLQHTFAWHANWIRRPSFSILWARLLMGSQTPTDRHEQEPCYV